MAKKREVELTLTLDTSVFERQLNEAVAKASGTRVAVGGAPAGGGVSAATAVGGPAGAATAAEEQAVNAAIARAESQAGMYAASVGGAGGPWGGLQEGAASPNWSFINRGGPSQVASAAAASTRRYSSEDMGSYGEYSGGYRETREGRQHLGPLLTLGLVSRALRSAGDVAGVWSDLNSSDPIRSAQGIQSAWHAASQVPVFGAAAQFAYGFSGYDRTLNRQIADEQQRVQAVAGGVDLSRAQDVGFARLGGNDLAIAGAEGVSQIRQAKQIALLTGNTNLVDRAKQLAAGQVALVRRQQNEFAAETGSIVESSNQELAGYGYLASGDGDSADLNFRFAQGTAFAGQLESRLSGVRDPTQRAQIQARNRAELSVFYAKQAETDRRRTGERDIQLTQLATSAAADYLRAGNHGYDANLLAIRGSTEAAAAGAELIGQPQVAAAIRNAGAAQTAAFVAEQGRQFGAGQRQLAYSTSITDQLIGRNPLGASLAGIAAQRNEALQQAREAGLTDDQFAQREGAINRNAAGQAFLAQRDFSNFRSDINRRLSGAEERTSLAIRGGPGSRERQTISSILEQTDLDVRGLEDQNLGDEAARRRRLGLNQLRAAQADFFRSFNFAEASPNRVFGTLDVGSIAQQFKDAEKQIPGTGRGAGATSGTGITEAQAAQMIELLRTMAQGFYPARAG